MLRNSLIAAAAALALGACAGAQTTENAGSSRDCFRAMDVSSYGIIDENTVRVRVSAAREYALSVRQNVRDLDWTHAISIRSTTSFICTGNGLGVQLLGGDPPVTYPVINIERLPPTAPAGS